jgi:hypothetical protein
MSEVVTRGSTGRGYRVATLAPNRTALLELFYGVALGTRNYPTMRIADLGRGQRP